MNTIAVGIRDYGFFSPDDTLDYCVLNAHYKYPDDYDENGCLSRHAIPDFYLVDGQRFTSLEEVVLFIAAAYDSSKRIYINMPDAEADKFVKLMQTVR